MSEHDRQQQASVFASLSKAGVGSVYHRRSLTEVAPPEVLEWARCPHDLMGEGRGWTIIGTSNAYDAAVLLARALHLQSFPCLVVPLRRLVKWTEHDTDQLETVETVRGLFITGFYDQFPGSTESPLKPWQVQDVEEILTTRLDNRLSVFPQVSLDLTGDTWWTGTMIRRLTKANRKVVIK